MHQQKNWAYIGPDGYAVKNAWKRDSKGWCYLNGDGIWVKNTWVTDSHGWCYIDETGYWDNKAQIVNGDLDVLNDGASHTGLYIIAKSGTYGAASETSPTVMNGDIIVSLPTEEGSGPVNLNNITVKGNIYVYGQSGTLNFTNVKADKLVTHGVMTLTGKAQFDYVEINSQVKIIGTGSIKYLILKSPDSIVDITLPEINTIFVDEKADDSIVKLNPGTAVKVVSVLAPVKVEGTGKITYANIGANGTVIEPAPSDVAVVPGVTAQVGNKVVDKNNAKVINKVPDLGTEPSEGTSGGSGAGGGGGAAGGGTVTYSASATLVGTGDLNGLTVSGTSGYLDLYGKSDNSRLTAVTIKNTGYTKVNAVYINGVNYLNSPVSLADGTKTFYVKDIFPDYDKSPDGVSLSTLRSLYGDSMKFTFATDNGNIVVTVRLSIPG